MSASATPQLGQAVPVLHVTSAQAARRFYVEALGFQCEFAYQAHPELTDPVYMGVLRGRAWLHLSSFSGDGVCGSVAYIIVDNVDALAAELRAKGVAIDSGPVTQTWGNREMYVRDPDRNCLRFIQSQE
jgi:catechol 2,3-dioxygenase-like lactoylglutathione lyase family enzyme